MVGYGGRKTRMEHAATFRFYEELNAFLPPARRKREIDYAFNGHPAVKDSIEALGVPHTEVELIVVNGDSVGFEHPLRHGDRVAVYPAFEALDIRPLVRVREAPLRRTSFILDVHLGKLARLLRLLGFDVMYRNDLADREIVDRARAEHRIILTRDRGLLRRRAVTHGCYIHHTEPVEQACEVVRRLDLADAIAPFTRCTRCNGRLTPVDRDTVLEELPPLTRRYGRSFARCDQCGKLYWKGTHYKRLIERIRRVRTPAGSPGR